MTNETTLIFETTIPIPFTVANATGIEKGTILKMTDPMTAVAASVDGDIVAGIASEEKIASDGLTKLGVYRRGIFKGIISGSVTVGDPLCIATGANLIYTASVNAEQILGTALETGTNGESILFELNPTVMQLA